MTGKVICTASPKGGSGKTIITATFGTILSSIGYRVLIVDVDSATHGLTLFYLKEAMRTREESLGTGRSAVGLFEAVASDQLPPTLVKLSDRLELLPATYRVAAGDDALSPHRFAGMLGAVVDAARGRYDYVILDAQAGTDEIAGVAISRGISDEVILVSEYDPLSAAGIDRMKVLFPEDLSYGRTWVLLNKMLPEFVKSFSDFLEVAKYLPPVPWLADVVRAYSRRELALDLAVGNDYTLGLLSTLKSLLGNASRLDEWLEERADLVRQPMGTQIDAAKRRLNALELIERRREVEEARYRLIATVAGAVGIGACVVESLLHTTIVFIALIPLILLIVMGVWQLGNEEARFRFVTALRRFVATFSPDVRAVRVSELPLSREALRHERRDLEDEIERLSAMVMASPEDLLWKPKSANST